MRPKIKLLSVLLLFFSISLFQNTVQAAKLLPPVDVELVPPSFTPMLGDSIYVGLRVFPKVSIRRAVVDLNVEGGIELVGEARVELGELQGGTEEYLTVQVKIARPGKGELRANLLALSPENERILFGRSSTLYFLADSEGVLIDDVGFISLEIKKLNKNVRYDIYREKLDRILGGGAIETNGNVQSTGKTLQKYSILSAFGTVTVSGQILWTDSAGNTHPVRYAPVEIRDEETVDSELVTTVMTDADGNYTATVDNNDGPGENGRDIFIRVLAKSDGFEIRPPGSPEIYRIDSSVYNELIDGDSLTINLTANNIDDNNTAFSIHDALVTAYDYVVLKGYTPGLIVVNYPTTDSTTNYDESDLDILGGDRFDWDVIQHEYGHYVADKLNISSRIGGEHGLEENLAERLGKDRGIRLAWGEGWPTYFAISLQEVMGAVAFGIPNVGDTHYQDTEDTTIDYDLESQNGGNSLGEDNELSVQRILYDLYDGNNDTGDEVSLGDTVIWNTLDAADPVNLSQAWNAIINGEPVVTQVMHGAIFTEHNVAPDPTEPPDSLIAGMGSIPPTFRWEPNGAGPTYRLDSFTVEFYNENFSMLIFSSPELSVNEYTPSEGDWATILSAETPIINWIVKGRNTSSSPETGTYVSKSHSIIPWPDDLCNQLLEAMGVNPADVISCQAIGTPNAFAVRPGLGIFTPTQGTNLAVISSGVAGAGTEGAPFPEPGIENFHVDDLATGQLDRARLLVKLQVPADANSLTFDFVYFSAEYPDYVGSMYNDEFQVLLDGVNNIASDPFGNPVSVNLVFFKFDSNNIPGTGYDIFASYEQDTGVCDAAEVDNVINVPNECPDAGSAGLINIEYPITLGSVIQLDFRIFDRGDHILDSQATIDNFYFSPEIVSPNMEPKDSDNDGWSDTEETVAGSDPLNPASTPEVCDGIDNNLDGQIDEGFPDTDADGQADCVDLDDDGDGLPDDWENQYGLNPLDPSDALADPDGDGFTNLQEYQGGSDPQDPASYPGQEDNDQDGLSDSDETNIYGTNPDNPDSDGDGIFDGYEVWNGLDPLGVNDKYMSDQDVDEWTDWQEFISGTLANDGTSMPSVIGSVMYGWNSQEEVDQWHWPQSGTPGTAQWVPDGGVDDSGYLSLSSPAGTSWLNFKTDEAHRSWFLSEGASVWVRNRGTSPLNVGVGVDEGDGGLGRSLNYGWGYYDQNTGEWYFNWNYVPADGLWYKIELYPSNQNDMWPGDGQAVTRLEMWSQWGDDVAVDIDKLTNDCQYCQPLIGVANDTDGDGLPDAWEIQYNLNPNDPDDAGMDTDGDGLTNLEEFIGGTDPGDTMSVPASQTVFDSNMQPLRLVTPPDATIISFDWIDPSTLPPASATFPYGLVGIGLALSEPGDSVTISLTFTGPVDPNSVYNKYGQTASDLTDHWYAFPFGSNNGDATITLTLTDGLDGDHDLAVNGFINDPGGPAIIPVNNPPMADAGPDQTVEATSPAGASLTLDGFASSDPDGDPLSYTWTGPFGSTTGGSPTVTIPLGTYTTTLTVTDTSGATATDTLQVTVVDTTPPAISSTQNPLTNANGWNNTEVTITFSATDVVSETIPCEIIAMNLQSISPITVPFNTEGSDQTITITCNDAAGNNATATHTVSIDMTSPAIIFGPIIPAPNAAGWNNTDVTIEFTTSDDLSGVAGTNLTTPLLFNTDGTGLTQSVTVTDLAGNSSTFISPPVNRDTVAPTVSASPAGGTYTAPQTVTLTASELSTIYYTTDGSTPTTSSTQYTGPININISTTLKFMAIDVADNSSITYTKNYSIMMPDLIVSALSTTTTAVAPGGSLSLSNTVKNQGSASAGSFGIAFHLSTDAVYGGTNDIAFTTTRSVSSLGGGASSGASTSVTVPSTTPLGTYYICSKADTGNTVSESNETNNTKCTTSTINVTRPDLVMTAVTPGASTVNAGAALSVTNTAKNQGGLSAGSFTIAFRLSKNTTYGDSDDVSISATRSVSSLGAGASNTATTSLTIPSTTKAGNYYVCTKADSSSAITESIENNNTLCSSTQVTVPKPDLIMTALSTTTTAIKPGSSLSLSNTVKNQGGASASSFAIAFHLSVDAVYGGTDDIAFSTTRSVSSLGVGASSNASTSVTVPSTTPLGTYYICSKADSNGTVSESNETNNTRCTTSTINVTKPDLLMTAVTPGTTTVNAGATLSVTNTVKNQGGISAGSFTIAFRLSKNTTYGDSDDVSISTTRSVSSLAAGASSTATTGLTIPSTTKAGSYYVCTKADSGSTVAESIENNNTLCSSTQVTVPTPDIITSALSTSATTVTRGGSFSLSNTAKNQGGSSAGSFTIAFHLSTDAVYGGTDDRAFSTTRSVSSLGVGTSSSASTTLTVSSTTPVGSYYVCAKADSGSTVSEGTNEGNNTRCTAATIVVQ